MNKHKTYIIAGGGTGGHIFPAIAIANALRANDSSCDILFVGAKGKMEMEKVPKEGYAIVGLDIVGFQRGAWGKNLMLPFKLLKSFTDAWTLLKHKKPDVVIGVGGYASFPVLFIAQKMGIPTVIQEQNSFAGKSNIILGKKASAICVAYDGMERFFPASKILKTGNPVRKNITATSVNKATAVDFFSLDSSKKIVFAFGGSLGAKSINEAIAVHVKQFVDADIQLIWQTGSHFFEQAKRTVQGFENNIKVFEFIREMDMAYAAADIMISRAGASSIAELSIVAKPVLFVPFPFASEDHQTHNAMSLVNQEAAIMIKDQDVKEQLISAVMALIQDEEKCKQMQLALKQFAVTNADQLIANKIKEIIA